MSMDKSLKKGGGLVRARNVLTRPERLLILQMEEKWTEEKGVYNIPKTKYRVLPAGQSGPRRPGEVES
jgi:small basic protein (TIGR04137 family)